jgi:hypothetical protein
MIIAHVRCFCRAHLAAAAGSLPPLPLPPAGSSSWAIRSKASLLLALVIKRTGPELWEAALPQLLQAAAEGPAMQEQVGAGKEQSLLSPCLSGEKNRHDFSPCQASWAVGTRPGCMVESGGYAGLPRGTFRPQIGAAS